MNYAYFFLDETGILQLNVHFPTKHAFFLFLDTTRISRHHMYFRTETCVFQRNRHFRGCILQMVDVVMFHHTMLGTTSLQECRYSKPSSLIFLSMDY